MKLGLCVPLCYLMVVAAPAGSGAQSVPKIKYEKYTLPNGLEVILHEDHSTPIVAVNTWYHVGSGDEKPGRTGFAHLFEHIMFMGSEHVPVGVFDKEREAAGGDNNGSTTEDRTEYHEVVRSNALSLVLWLDSDRMGFLLPTMDLPKVDLQRDVVKNERRQSVDNVQSIDAVTQTDVQRVAREYINPAALAIVIVGDRKSIESGVKAVNAGPLTIRDFTGRPISR